MGISTAQIVDVQCKRGMIHETLEELPQQIHVEVSDTTAYVGHFID